MLEGRLDSSATSCLYWLWYLATQCGGNALYDEVSEEVALAARLCSIPGDLSIYGAELQLVGKKGVDLSVQFPLALFAQGNPFSHTAFAQEAEFFRFYGEKLRRLDPSLYRDNMVYLEADTSRGVVERVAFFLNVYGAKARELTAFSTEQQGLSRECVATVDKLLTAAVPYLGPWYYGFMRSRSERPLRLALKPAQEGKMTQLLKGISKIPFLLITEEMHTIWQQLDSLGIFKFLFDIDILPDGSIGDIIGLELFLEEKVPTAQREILAGDAFNKFTQLLRSLQMADARLEVLPHCLWGRQCTVAELQHIYIYSTISHFKLQWRKGIALPAKVYLQLLPVPRQENVNEGMRRARIEG